jgi:hypothetical protein
VTRESPHSAHPQDPDADRLSAAWNEIVAGLDPIAEDDLTATARSLHAGAPDHRSTSTFRDNLRETLMQTAVPIEMPALRQPPHIREQASESRLRIPAIMGGRAVRWTAIAATVALLLTTLWAGYLGGLYPPGSDSDPTNLAAPLTGTPVSAPPTSSDIQATRDSCGELGLYFVCGPNQWVADAVIDGDVLGTGSSSETGVRMEGWELDGGKGLSFREGPPSERGMGIDLIVSGAYSAKFSQGVIVSRPMPGGGKAVEYPAANTVVELSRGDAVVYVLGTKMEMGNPLARTVLVLKSIVISDGNSTQDSYVTSGDYRYHLDGTGRLPQALSEMPSHNLTIALTYVPKGMWAPSEDLKTRVVLGPVASMQAEQQGSEGFVVWAFVPQG